MTFFERGITQNKIFPDQTSLHATPGYLYVL